MDESGQTYRGIQTVCRGRDGTWWFGCYGHLSPSAYVTDDHFNFIGKHVFDSSLGIARTKDDNVLWVAKGIKREGKRNTGSVRTVKTDVILAK